VNRTYSIGRTRNENWLRYGKGMSSLTPRKLHVAYLFGVESEPQLTQRPHPRVWYFPSEEAPRPLTPAGFNTLSGARGLPSMRVLSAAVRNRYLKRCEICGHVEYVSHVVFVDAPSKMCLYFCIIKG
jgi:hypothetical protein